MQSSSQIITTNKPTSSCFFTGRVPFLSPNQQCQSTEGKKYHIPWTCSPQAHLQSTIVVMTTYRFVVTLRRVAKDLVSTSDEVLGIGMLVRRRADLNRWSSQNFLPLLSLRPHRRCFCLTSVCLTSVYMSRT